MTAPHGEARLGTETFEAFYASSKDRVLRAVLAATGDDHDAEDCTAEAFSRALERWDDVRTRTAPAAWVVRTAVNLHIDRHRHHQRTLRLLPTLADSEQGEPPALPLDPALLAALRALPERQRHVLALRILLGLSGEQTALELGITTGSVGTHLHRALRALRPHVAPDGEVDPR